MRTIVLAALLSSATAGCGDDPSCDKAVKHVQSLGPELISAEQIPKLVEACKSERWSGAMRRCLVKAKGLSDAKRCSDEEDDRPKAGGARARRSEAELNLDAIGKAARANFVENATYPQYTAPLTPARPCCEGPGKKCPAQASDWSGVDAWDALDFELTQPSFFQYSYASDGPNSFVAEAVGDLDCDGTTVTYTLRGTVSEGVPLVELTKPDHAD